MFYLFATKSHTFILSHFLLLLLMNCPSSCRPLSQIKMSLGFLFSSSYDLITLLPFPKRSFFKLLLRVSPHLNSHSLIGPNESCFCPYHFTEIIFVKVTHGFHVATSEHFSGFDFFQHIWPFPPFFLISMTSHFYSVLYFPISLLPIFQSLLLTSLLSTF